MLHRPCRHQKTPFCWSFWTQGKAQNSETFDWSLTSGTRLDGFHTPSERESWHTRTQGKRSASHQGCEANALLASTASHCTSFGPQMSMSPHWWEVPSMTANANRQRLVSMAALHLQLPRRSRTRPYREESNAFLTCQAFYCKKDAKNMLIVIVLFYIIYEILIAIKSYYHSMIWYWYYDI